MNNSFAQTKEIEIIQNNINDSIVLSIKNNSTERKQVSVTITGSGFQKIKMPITKNVNKNEIEEFVTLKPVSKKGINFNIKYTYISISSANEIKNANKIEIDFSKGIFIFTKIGCPRCSKVLNYLNDNNIKYTDMETTKNKEFNNLMWQKLRENKVSNTILMPVIIINGKVTHSHKDLDSFLKKIE